MGHPTMQENDTAKLTPTIIHISIWKHLVLKKLFLNKLQEIL